MKTAPKKSSAAEPAAELADRWIVPMRLSVGTGTANSRSSAVSVSCRTTALTVALEQPKKCATSTERTQNYSSFSARMAHR